MPETMSTATNAAENNTNSNVTTDTTNTQETTMPENTTSQSTETAESSTPAMPASVFTLSVKNGRALKLLGAFTTFDKAAQSAADDAAVELTFTPYAVPASFGVPAKRSRTRWTAQAYVRRSGNKTYSITKLKVRAEVLSAPATAQARTQRTDGVTVRPTSR